MENKLHTYHKYKYPVNSIPDEPKRRSFLKYIFFGGGFFMLGKIFGPNVSFFSSDTDLSSITNFENFRVVESGKELQFFDKMGNEILTLDKEA